MAMRNAYEFAKDVADAFREASGFGMQEVIDDLSAELVTYDVNPDYRKAVVRLLLSWGSTEEEATRLLALQPPASEAATYARALLTKTTRTARRSRNPDLDIEEVAKGLLMIFFIGLLPKSAKILGLTNTLAP